MRCFDMCEYMERQIGRLNFRSSLQADHSLTRIQIRPCKRTRTFNPRQQQHVCSRKKDRCQSPAARSGPQPCHPVRSRTSSQALRTRCTCVFPSRCRSRRWVAAMTRSVGLTLWSQAWTLMRIIKVSQPPCRFAFVQAHPHRGEDYFLVMDACFSCSIARSLASSACSRLRCNLI